MANIAPVTNAVGTKHPTSSNPEFLDDSLVVTKAYLETGKNQPAIAKETPLAKRGILIELSQRELLQQQTKAMLQSAFDAITPVQQKVDTLEPELKFCHHFKKFIVNYSKIRSTSVFLNPLCFKFLKDVDKCDDILKKWDTNKINKIISSGKSDLTIEEKNRIIEVKDLFSKYISEDFSILLDVLKNIFTANDQQKYNNDYELLSFFMDWTNQFSTKHLFKKEFLLHYREYMLSITMLQVLDIDPHIIFTFKSQQIKKLEKAYAELSKNFIKPIFTIINQNDDSCLEKHSIFSEFVMYKILDKLFSNGLENCNTLIQDKSFIEFFTKYIVSFIYEHKSTDSTQETSDISPISIPDKGFDYLKNKLLIGDEFEFWLVEDTYMSEQEYKSLTELWIKELKETCKEKNITQYKIDHLEDTNGYPKYKITIGEWSYCMFIDGSAMEVTPQPYRVEDKFSIKTKDQQQEEYSIVKLYDDFIFNIAKKLYLKGRSGHKHFDTRAFHGNAGLLFRLTVYFQNNAWLPQAFDRMNRISNYPFIANKEEDISQPLIQEIIACINENLQSGNYISKINYHDDIVSVSQILYSFENIKIADKWSPFALHHIVKSEEITADLMVEPTSTMELRFFNCPENGENAMSVNELVIDIIQFLLDEQNNNKPMKLDCINPLDYSKEQAIDEYKKMLNELGCDDEKKAKYLKLIPWLNFN